MPFYSLHMNESHLITFHTLLSSTVLQTKQLVHIDYKCGWMAENNSTKAKACKLSFFLPSILICCRLSFLHTHRILLPIVSAAAVALGKTVRQRGRQTSSEKDRGLKEKRPNSRPLHPYRFIICAVAQDISQLCLPWILLWVLGGRARRCRCDYPFTDPPTLRPQNHPLNPPDTPPPFFNTSSDTINKFKKKKIYPNSRFPQDHNSQRDSKSKLYLRGDLAVMS